MSEGRKLAAILVADMVGFRRLAGEDEERILARLRALRGDLIDPHRRASWLSPQALGNGVAEFRSVVDAVRCAIEVQNAMVNRNVGVAGVILITLPQSILSVEQMP
jgi:class 3 adenylate cyclase